VATEAARDAAGEAPWAVLVGEEWEDGQAPGPVLRFHHVFCFVTLRASPSGPDEFARRDALKQKVFSLSLKDFSWQTWKNLSRRTDAWE